MHSRTPAQSETQFLRMADRKPNWPFLTLHACVGLVLGVVGIYGLLLAFAGAWYELAQAWGSFSLWCWNLAHGLIKVPPATFRSTLINAELTWLISSIFPLMLLGVGICLCRESLTAWRKVRFPS